EAILSFMGALSFPSELLPGQEPDLAEQVQSSSQGTKRNKEVMRMSADHASAIPSLEERLERAEIVYYPTCPFPLPEGEDREFLLQQHLGRGHKNIGYDPHNGTASGYRFGSRVDAERLHQLLAWFSRTATAWLASTLPR